VQVHPAQAAIVLAPALGGLAGQRLSAPEVDAGDARDLELVRHLDLHVVAPGRPEGGRRQKQRHVAPVHRLRERPPQRAVDLGARPLLIRELDDAPGLGIGRDRHEQQEVVGQILGQGHHARLLDEPRPLVRGLAILWRAAEAPEGVAGSVLPVHRDAAKVPLEVLRERGAQHRLGEEAQHRRAHGIVLAARKERQALPLLVVQVEVHHGSLAQQGQRNVGGGLAADPAGPQQLSGQVGQRKVDGHPAADPVLVDERDRLDPSVYPLVGTQREDERGHGDSLLHLGPPRRGPALDERPGRCRLGMIRAGDRPRVARELDRPGLARILGRPGFSSAVARHRRDTIPAGTAKRPACRPLLERLLGAWVANAARGG